jgi:gamma-glutamyl hercynylcysteine S-oxide synthase
MRGIYHSPFRSADSNALALALVETRNNTHALMEAWTHARPSLSVPNTPQLNPPLWEWGHLAWFQEWWTVRNQERHLGIGSSSSGPSFSASLMPQADALYNSSLVAHPARWSLPLPHLEATLAYMGSVLQQSLDNLSRVNRTDDNALYFWRLALFHEAMHNEASVYMAQALGLPIDPPAQRLAACTNQSPDSLPTTLHIQGQTIQQGYQGQGFAFDNECAAHEVDVEGFEIDTEAIKWAPYIDFLQDTHHPLPSCIRCEDGQWQLQRFGLWHTLNMQDSVSHVSAWDAQAWCQWAGRRLPTEAEWNCAAQHPDFEWGHVWEWTISPFAPFAGFEPHPYEDYSAPWWHTHRVLKGASWATPACLIDSRFRNFFMPDRHDLVCGFRTVTL